MNIISHIINKINKIFTPITYIDNTNTNNKQNRPKININVFYISVYYIYYCGNINRDYNKQGWAVCYEHC